MTAQPTKTADQPTDAGRSVTEIRRQPIVVQNELMIFDTGKFEQMQRVAAAMAEMKLMPEHLRKSPADCLLVVEQAWRWQMSPTAVASKTFSVGGKLGYEGQLIAAVINSSNILAERLSYVYEGEFIDGAPEPKKVTRSVWVVGHIKGEKEPRKIELWWKDGYAASKGARDKWLSQPDQQLAYAGARVWGRRHVPELLLGVYLPEELEDEANRIGPDRARDITPPRPTRASVAAEPPEATPEQIAEAEAAARRMDQEAEAIATGKIATDEGHDPETGEVNEVTDKATDILGPWPKDEPAQAAWRKHAAETIDKAPDLAELARIEEECQALGLPEVISGEAGRLIKARRKKLPAKTEGGK